MQAKLADFYFVLVYFNFATNLKYLNKLIHIFNLKLLRYLI